MGESTRPISALLEDLGDPAIERRVAALARMADIPNEARQALAKLILDESASDTARAWAAIGIGQIGDDVAQEASSALISALANAPAAVRWSAIHALGGLRASHAVYAIVGHLDDDEEVEGAWFEDDCRVSQAAAHALRQIGTDEALQALPPSAPGVSMKEAASETPRTLSSPGALFPLFCAAFACTTSVAFVSVRSGLWQLLSMLGIGLLLLAVPFVIAHAWRRRSTPSWKLAVPLGACVLAVPLGVVIGDAHHHWYFEHARRPAYERFLKELEAGEIALDQSGQTMLNPPPKYLQDLAHVVHIHRPDQMTTAVEFFYSGGYPVKHAAHVFRPSGTLAKVEWVHGETDETEQCRWPHSSRLDGVWFRTID